MSVLIIASAHLPIHPGLSNLSALLKLALAVLALGYSSCSSCSDPRAGLRAGGGGASPLVLVGEG